MTSRPAGRADSIAHVVAGVDELAQLLSELVELALDGGQVIEARAEIAEQLLVVEVVLNASEIASIALVGNSAVSVNSAAVVNREPFTTMSTLRKAHHTPKKVHHAPWKVLRSIVKLTRASGKLSRYVVSDGSDRARAPRAWVRAPRAAVCDPRC